MADPQKALEEHRSRRGKYEILSKAPLGSSEELSIFYTPGVAYVAEEISKDAEKVYEYTTKSNTIAIVSDGTRILGLGDVGPQAGLPVMEGKAILFKKYGGVDAVPLCIGTKDEAEIIRFVTQIAPTFGGINIEDIESPKSFRIVDTLSRTLDIPVFHDDQQGTGVVVLAALLNSLKLAGKGKDAKIVISGAGSAGLGIVRILMASGFRNLYVLDSQGLIYRGRKENMNEFKEEIARITNPEASSGGISDAAKGADALVGVSIKGTFSKDLISVMAEKPIVFALSNPNPEISYADAMEAGVYIAATGSSKFPNQVNNVLAFPAIMRGLLDIRAKGLNNEMLTAAAVAIAKSVGRGLGPEKIVPNPTDGRTMIKVAGNVSFAVASAAMKTGMARISRDPNELRSQALAMIRRYWRIERRILR